MISISLNQTESEKRLHRILYFVKYLRALILNWVLIVLAIALYIAFGITGLYPAADDTLNGLRGLMSQLDPYFVPIAFEGFLIALFIWLYISITRVWRKSLKAQVILFVICCPVLLGL